MRLPREVDSRMGWGALGLFLQTCVGLTDLGAPRVSAQTLDSGTNSCRQNPALCVRMTGEESVVPGPSRDVAEAGFSAGSLGMVLGSRLQTLVERALVECADLARSQVLLERRQGQSPSEEECRQMIPGTSVTLAMQLGQEMHQAATRCATEKLEQLIPGRFSMEPRYRYNPMTEKTTFISEEEAQLLLQQGRGVELKGTLRPDVVIHSGDPLQAQGIYDFKFGCTGKKPAQWAVYPEGHPQGGLSQRDLYISALRGLTRRVIPRWGIME